jgi:hypothetical protein
MKVVVLLLLFSVAVVHGYEITIIKIDEGYDQLNLYNKIDYYCLPSISHCVLFDKKTQLVAINHLADPKCGIYYIQYLKEKSYDSIEYIIDRDITVAEISWMRFICGHYPKSKPMMSSDLSNFIFNVFHTI